MAAGFLQDCLDLYDGWTYSSSQVEFNDIQEARTVLQHHRENACSWLHHHTVLPMNVATLVGEFLCPPPVFFFEEGDLCLDIEWDTHVLNSFQTCIIARRLSEPLRKRRHSER
jgi:hypothetical protein